MVLGLPLGAALAQAAPESPSRPEEPETDFLDFLGTWQNEQGRWGDPFQIAEDVPVQTHVESKTDQPGPARGAHKPSKDMQPKAVQDGPRDPMKRQTDP
jgi:hypothetical protein